MSLNGVNHVSDGYGRDTSVAPKKSNYHENAQAATAKNAESDAVVYKSSTEKKTGKTDYATIERMKADAEARNAQLRSLVEKMMIKQGKTFNSATDMYALLRSGDLEVDETTASQAMKDISEDGYWGVEKTSDRLVSFAKALAGNDADKADKLIKAVKKGFDAATKSWGDELPDICKKTLDVTIEKLNKWKEEVSGTGEE